MIHLDFLDGDRFAESTVRRDHLLIYTPMSSIFAVMGIGEILNKGRLCDSFDVLVPDSVVVRCFHGKAFDLETGRPSDMTGRSEDLPIDPETSEGFIIAKKNSKIIRFMGTDEFIDVDERHPDSILPETRNTIHVGFSLFVEAWGGNDRDCSISDIVG